VQVMKMSKVHTILVILMLLFGGVLFSSVLNPVSAQTAQPTDTPTPNPTIVALENIIATQQILLEAQSRTISNTADDLSRAEKDWQWKWGIAGLVLGALGSILASIGVSSVTDFKKKISELEKEWDKRSALALNYAVYKLDMSNIPILLPADENVGSIRRLLQQRKFEKIKYYKNYNELEGGVLVVSLKGKNEEEQKKTLDKFKDFIETQLPSAITTGFIIYSPDRITVPTEIMNCHDNLVTANYPATVISSIFTVGRGIDIPNPKDEIKEGG